VVGDGRDLPRRPPRVQLAASPGRVVVGFVIIHLGTMISLDDFKRQWKTFLIGVATVVGIGVSRWPPR